jgi:hypothetical protein
LFAESGPLTAAAFARVRGALRQVPVNGTASGLADRLRVVTKDTIVVLAKTGTLNESSAGGKLKSLAIAMGRPAGKGVDAALTCGLVAITYFEFAQDRRAKGQRAALPRIHRDFAEVPFADVMSRHWGRVSGCTAPVLPSKPPLGQVASK